MSLFTSLAGLLRAPVGNNLDNQPEDVENLKRNFAAIGRYKKPVENGYIDQELDDAIYSHQQDHNLKVDGIMKPGGETEASMISQKLKLPKRDSSPEDKQSGIQQANAVPLFGALAMGLGMTAAGAAQWWQSQSADDRDKIVKSLSSNNQSQENSKEERRKTVCDKMYSEDFTDCEVTEKIKGRDAGRICKETAFDRYSKCLTDKPADQWPWLQR